MILKYKQERLSILEQTDAFAFRVVTDCSKPLVAQVKSMTMTEYYPIINGRFVIDEKFKMCSEFEICFMTKQSKRAFKSNSVKIIRG